MSYKIGDIVPYRNTRGNRRFTKITSFQTVDNGKVWFCGIDTLTKAKVWYPVHISEKLVEIDLSCELEKSAQAAAEAVGYNPKSLGDVAGMVYYKDGFKKGAKWQAEKAIQAFIEATDGYFIVGGTDYSKSVIEAFKSKLSI